MKKFVLGFVTAAMLFVSVGVYAATEGKVIEVFNNFKSSKFDDVAKTTSNTPFLYNGTTYVPIRFIAENFDKEVIWDSKSQSILIDMKDSEIPNVAYLGGDVQYMNYQAGSAYNNHLQKVFQQSGPLHKERTQFILQNCAR